MKKYYPVDFDEKGNAVLGTPKNKPTSNGFIPTTWAPGGSGDGIGIKSITISPAISTTPPIESLCPIYYGDERIVGDEFTAELRVDELEQPATVTITPTADVYIGADMEGYAEFTNKGEARTFEIEPHNHYISLSDFCFCKSTDYADVVYLNISITGAK